MDPDLLAWYLLDDDDDLLLLSAIDILVLAAHEAEEHQIHTRNTSRSRQSSIHRSDA